MDLQSADGVEKGEPISMATAFAVVVISWKRSGQEAKKAAT
jgi:hypothetical protein